MKIIKTAIPEVLILEPKVFGDDRGFFYESYNKQKFKDTTGISCDFVQDNHSMSTKGVLRGLHYQVRQSQAKLVRVISGEVFDVAVDIRQKSTTFGQWVGVNLSSENNKQMWIPEGFAHGFLVLSEQAEFVYKASNYYSPEHERCIRWDDESLDIHWPISVLPAVSEKDNHGLSLTSAEIFL